MSLRLQPPTARQIEIFRILSAHQESRNRLVADFISEKPALYHSMFEYEAGSVDMDMALTRYFFFWLDSLPSIYEELYLSGEDSLSEKENILFDGFLDSYRKFCQRFVLENDLSPDKITKNVANPMIDSLLKNNIQVLGELLKSSERADERMQKLRYQATKSKALFERQFSELRMKQNDNSST